MDEKEIEALAHRMAWRYAKSQDPHHSDTYTFNRYCLLRFVDELLAKARVTAAPATHPDTADAERYRWLREHGDTRCTEKDGYGGRTLLMGDDLDAAIDAARAKAQGSKP